VTVDECIEQLKRLKESGKGDYKLINADYGCEPYVFQINDDAKTIEYQ
jgi:hypothetical protein